MPANLNQNGQPPAASISSIAVSGFKSIATEQSIEIRPLTLLAGANSSGKSSMMQAVLLLKQTLETSYDPGPLLLNGPNVRFTSADQILFHSAGSPEVNEILIRIGFQARRTVEVVFARESGKRLDLQHCIYTKDGFEFVVTSNMQEASILALFHVPPGTIVHPHIDRYRCFLSPSITSEDGTLRIQGPTFVHPGQYSMALQDLLHIPGVRGNRDRTYPQTSSGPLFPGTFEKYMASIVAKWSHDSPEQVEQLGRDLNALELTWKVEAKELDDTQIELRVARLRKSQGEAAPDMVNIADVGSGVSHGLPVLVALLVAQPGQLLYIEEPEIHLHPRAQVAMASLIAKAAMRGVHVVVETHSSLLLLGVQSQVAEQKLDASLVKLHWFTRNDTTGASTITSADMDEAGRFGDWPEDFDDVSLKTQAHYLDTVEALLAPE